MSRIQLFRIDPSGQGLFVALVFNLVNQYIFRLAEFPGHADVEFTLQRVFAALEDDQVYSTANLCNQWLHFWQVAVCEVKFPHVEYISAGIADDAGKLLALSLSS